MTPELAERILSRRPKVAKLTEAQSLEVLMDWLEGMTYREITAKRNVTKYQITEVVRKAREESKAIMEGKE